MSEERGVSRNGGETSAATEEERLPATWAEWELDVLASADEAGCVAAWQTMPWFSGMSHLMGLQLRGLLRRRDGPHGGPWVITPAGRAFLAESASSGSTSAPQGNSGRNP